jgi:hypothetical protein
MVMSQNESEKGDKISQWTFSTKNLKNEIAENGFLN